MGPRLPARRTAAALLARAVERASGIDGGQTVRLAYDILGPVPVGPVRVSTSVLRPGRRIELLEAVLSGADDRPLMRLTAWRMRVRDDGATPADAPPVPVRPVPRRAAGDGGVLHPGRRLPPRAGLAVRVRLLQRPRPGRGVDPVPCALVEGEPITPLEHLLVMTDAASGISASWTGRRRPSPTST